MKRQRVPSGEGAGAWNQDEAPVTGGSLLGLFSMFALGVLVVVGAVLHLTGGIR